jgi:hypothetical protein
MTVKLTRFIGTGTVTVSGGDAAAESMRVALRSGGSSRRRDRHLRLIRGDA